MNVDYVRAHGIGQHSLIFEFTKRICDDLRMGRRKDDKLVGVETETYIIFAGKGPGFVHLLPNVVSFREILQAVRDRRMRHAREKRRHDPESPDSQTLDRFKR